MVERKGRRRSLLIIPWLLHHAHAFFRAGPRTLSVWRTLLVFSRGLPPPSHTLRAGPSCATAVPAALRRRWQRRRRAPSAAVSGNGSSHKTGSWQGLQAAVASEECTLTSNLIPPATCSDCRHGEGDCETQVASLCYRLPPHVRHGPCLGTRGEQAANVPRVCGRAAGAGRRAQQAGTAAGTAIGTITAALLGACHTPAHSLTTHR